MNGGSVGVKEIIRNHQALVIRTILPGLFDVGSASLATFLVGLYAVRVFEPSILGAYALAFSAFVLVSNIPAQMIFVPCQVESISLERHQRLSVVGRSLQLGLPVAVLSAL